jgi:hypothetical protein
MQQLKKAGPAKTGTRFFLAPCPITDSDNHSPAEVESKCEAR